MANNIAVSSPKGPNSTKNRALVNKNRKTGWRRRKNPELAEYEMLKFPTAFREANDHRLRKFTEVRHDDTVLSVTGTKKGV